MKRSEINNIICENKRLCNEARFYLPIWADWTPAVSYTHLTLPTT